MEGCRALRSRHCLDIGPVHWSIWQHPNHLCVRKGSVDVGEGGVGECVFACVFVAGGGRGENERGREERASERERERARDRARARERARATFSSEREERRERETLTA